MLGLGFAGVRELGFDLGVGGEVGLDECGELVLGECVSAGDFGDFLGEVSELGSGNLIF